MDICIWTVYVCSVYAIPVLFYSFLLMEMVCRCTMVMQMKDRLENYTW